MDRKRDFIETVGGEDTFRIITQFLKPWERIALRAVSTDFNKLMFLKHHRVMDHYHFLDKFWRTNFQRSVIQLYCRPLLDYATGSANFFKYHTLLQLSMDDNFTEFTNPIERLRSLKYCLRYQDELAKSPLNLSRPYEIFSKNIRDLEGLYISNRTATHSDALNRFLEQLLVNYSKIDNSRFKLLFFNHTQLGDVGMSNICNTILQSPVPFALEMLFLSNDVTLGDESINTLLHCIESKLSNVRMICLRNTGISNVSCDMIHAFYRRHYKALCQCQEKSGQSEDAATENEEFQTESVEVKLANQYPIRLNNINITFNQGITSEGIRRLNELFFLDDECNVPHRKDCFFSSVAIGTSVSLDGTQGLKLSSRFRFINQSE